MRSTVALVTSLLLALTLGPAQAGAAPARGTYENPLAPRVPGGGTVDSCADPTVLRGQQPRDRAWYLYCTTDPLSDGDVDDNNDLVFHPIPIMRSTDLVNWRYVGDALPDPPAWAAEGAGLWAPDVVYSKATNRYYMTFVVTDTEDSLRGPEACASSGDSAIGVAVSNGPTGPWRMSQEPVVMPRPDPGGACAFFWTFDPDVLGDAIGERGILYYGSYYGGLHATTITLDRRGMRAVGEPTQVSIGNRYEGTNVVERRGWYWLFGSATNCCNGPLTSYGVFAARSRSPFGPFRDREGRSILTGRVGGSPVLLPSGNRWVGLGHNSVFTDAAGRWWTAYHAVDRRDPYFTTDPGFTKRPVLLDPLDWIDGWPTVRAGRGASAGPMAAPATRAGDPSDYRPRPPAPPRVGRVLERHSDDFEDGLDPDWAWTREPEPASFGVEGGALRFDTQAGDLYVDSNTASVLARPAPAGDYAVDVAMTLDVPREGCCQNFVQGGFVLRAAGAQADDRFVKLVHASIYETRQTEWAKEVPRAPAEYPRYGNGVVGPPGDVTTLRIVVDRRAGRDRFTAWTRQDDRAWVRGGTWTHELGANAEIGLLSMGGTGFTTRFLDVTTRRVR
ncbi:MAG: family 43 glycosylhydrolase [Nocardioides sp.]